MKLAAHQEQGKEPNSKVILQIMIISERGRRLKFY